MYRIKEETNTATNESKFYLEKKVKFLMWSWWREEKIHHPQFGTLRYDFETKEKAQDYINSYAPLETTFH